MDIESRSFLQALPIEFEVLRVVHKEYCHEKVKEGISIAKSKAPVGTGIQDEPGKLANSIGIISESSNHIDWGTTVDYAPEVEYGNTKDKAQPFMRPAMARVTRGV